MLCAAALVVVALFLNGGHKTPNEGAPAPEAAPSRVMPTPRSTSSDASATPSSVGPHLPRSRPLRLLIPKISVDAPFTDLAIGAKGQLDPPPAGDTNLVGWYAKGASPGESGTAIVAGHVDTTTSAAVFAELDELRKGDTFQIVRADGRRPTFVVDDAETYSKSAFPSDLVYDDTPRAEVRLITCAGTYDHAVRDYTDNLVVFAHLK
ncbi:class F sortase [Streptomyces mangrovisoli]|uniref:Class F sortase n=2 Tax=Streptomyces mangrovisoli TaxID=1428628 RepID=A0A1J4NPL5_9ACTN|nr:class F sortase [Streptomyces mangrovisoli]